MNSHGFGSKGAACSGCASNSSRPVHGFTLVELMIVVAVIAILASLALVSYRTHVLHANRNAAEDTMLGIASAEERYLIDNRAYVATAASVGYPSSDSNYTYALTVGSAPPSYSITATPSGNQANDTSCNVLTLTSAGAKTASGTSSSTCWQ